jgi:hypothetical protein
MRSIKSGSRGFTLIASLLLMLLLSGVAVALLMMVNTEQRSGASDLSNNYTYRATEGAIEKQTSDLANTFKSIQSPTSGQICAVNANLPTWDPTVTYPVYKVAPVNPGAPDPCLAPLPPPVWGQIAAGGQDAGLWAQIIPVTLNASAQRFNGETVSMTRTAEVALIPVFQFGVFCEGDCFFGRSPNLGFAGRVHTNGDLYLGVANGYKLVFGDKISAFGNVIRQQMDNQVPTVGNDNSGTVLIPTTSGGCDPQMLALNTGGAVTASATCVDISTTLLGATDGSVTGGHGSGQVGANWSNTSWGTYNSYIIDGNGPANPPPAAPTDGPFGTGATDLTLPFVNGTTHPFEIIRRPPVGELATSLLGGSRLANVAQIRILLSDKEADLHLPGWNGNAAQDVELASLSPEFVGTAFSYNGIQVPAGVGPLYYFGEAACGTGAVGSACTTGDAHFMWPPWVPGGATATQYATQAEWPLVNGWLLVEVKNQATGLWVGVTQEWLGLGFARGVNVPTQPGFTCAASPANTLGATGCNAIFDHRNAILYFQLTADRNGDGTISALDAIGPFTSVVTHGSVTTTPLTYSGANSQYNWYPINFYDTREGENNDQQIFGPGPTGTANGVMNAVELDVGNLKNWLRGLTGTPTGQNVDFVTQNGYVLYFSDRRGMQYDPNIAHNPSNILLGAYGFEDVVNYAGGAPFMPNGTLEPVNYNGVSPEDVEMWNDGTVTKYGVKTVGDAFGSQTATDTDVNYNPFAHRINTFTVGRANRVTGARHVLKLVDGSLGSLPTMPPGNASNNCSQTAANPTGCGGFTVASENPVYIQGNYNSNCPAAVGGAPNPCTPGSALYDSTWTNPANPEPLHSAAAVIADAVTMLSNNWQDAGAAGSITNGSLLNPLNPGVQSVPAQTPNRIAVSSYYRVAVAGGKTIAFKNTAQNPEFAFGMDGGIHNFLRFLEDWGGVPGSAAQQQLWYKGSLVSLYWNTYATGTFKCCNLVYNPPDRQYTFDPLFSIPSNLPPGTPMFRNVDNLSYRQNQFARTN